MRPEPDDAGQVEVGAVRIAWEAFGRRDAQPLVLIMGLGSQMVWWDADLCVALAARGFRVVRYDHRDIGLSSKLDHLGVPPIGRMAIMHRLGLAVRAPYSLDAMADDALGLIDALGFDRAHVVGASMGGMIGQLLALRAPQRVASLCSWMSSMEYTPPRLRAGLVLLRRPPDDLEGWAEAIVTAQRTIGSPPPLFDEHDVRRRAREALARSRRRAGYARHLAAILAAPSRRARLASLRVPTLVMHGDRDPLVIPAAGRATAAAIAGARLKILPGVGHDMPRAIWPTAIDAIASNASRKP